MDSYTVLFALFFAGFTSYIWVRWGLRRQRKAVRKLPPGPKPLPIIGNMHQMGSTPHETFAKLSETYGPLVSIQLGSMHAIIVSSPEMAREILLKNGQAFSSRNIAEAAKACDHGKISMVFMPATSSKWRDLRRICKEKMFANQSLEASQGLRHEKLQQLLDYVQNCCDDGRVVDIREAGFITMLNFMTATLFSFKVAEFESQDTQDFTEIIEGITTVVGVPNFADFFPILRPFDPQGVRRKAEYYFGKLLAKIDTYIVERLESKRNFPDAPKKNDLLETLVDISQGNEYEITNDDIKHLLLDLFVGGAETANTTLIEWTMSELLLSPDKLSKLKEELKSVVGEDKQVQESDISRLPYLQAVIKEILRRYPPGPLLLPRAAASDQEINGYFIPKGTQVFINVWAMGRDPNIWPNPESFEPERFLDRRTDFKGQDFELIPFGAGRRICPGMPLANRILHVTTANLIHKFDWILEGPDQHDLTQELHGLALRRAVPLRAIPIKP